MNGINNNLSNSNYGSLGNNGSNSPKEEKSIFDNIVDSVKEFFDGDDDNQFSSYDSKTNSHNSNVANIDRAYFNARANMKNSYTLAPETKTESLGEKWAKDNESAALKQKENEIMSLKQKVGVLENRNKVLSQQNEYMIDKMPKTAGVEQQMPVQAKAVSNANETDTEPVEQVNKTKVFDSIPTHTLISNDIFEKQQSDIEEFAQTQKVEAPAEKKDDLNEKKNEEVKA